MATTADIKIGLVIEFNSDLFTIVDFQHVKPGKGPAFVRTKLKNMKSGKVIDNTFSSGHKIEIQRVERRPYQFLYKDDLGYHFMNMETYDQVPISEDKINAPEFLKEGQDVEILYHTQSESFLSCELPAFVALEITYTEPGVRGDSSSTNSLKPATLETGATVYVPLFIETGEKIKVDTRTKTYSERVK